MRATTCDRNGCTMQDGKHRTWAQLRDWICEECEGATTHRSRRDPETTIITDWVECGRCGGRELRPAGEIRKEQVDAVLILAGLPIELQQAADRARRKTQLSDVQLEAIEKILW
jgi:hypothetical protein